MRIDQFGRLILSRRNLLALLAQLDQKERTNPTLTKRCEDGSLIVVAAEENEVHYSAGQVPGVMKPATEAFIELHSKGLVTPPERHFDHNLAAQSWKE